MVGRGGTTLTSEEEARTGRGRKMAVGEQDGGARLPGPARGLVGRLIWFRGRDVGWLGRM